MTETAICTCGGRHTIVDGNGGHSPDCPARPEPVPADLWNENGDRVWIRYDLCESAGKARYKAFKGEGLPIGFDDDGLIRLTDLRVRVVWAREAPSGLHDEWPWKECGRDEPGAVRFWQVSAGGAS